MVIPNLPFEEYRKRPGINATLLKTVHRFSLAHAKAQIDGLLDDETDAKSLGTSFHAQLLEGRIDYVIHPKTYPGGTTKAPEEKPWNWNANFCKAWRDEQGEKSVVSEEQAKELDSMVTSAHGALGSDLLKGQRELSVFAEKDGHPVKCRIDLLPDDPTAPVIDIKRCVSAHPDEFLKQALKLGYHLQAAWTLDVLKWNGQERKEFWLVGIEPTAPFAAVILTFRDEPLSFVRLGRVNCRAAFQKLRNAYAANVWPAYGKSAAEDHTPAWMLKELEQTA